MGVRSGPFSIESVSVTTLGKVSPIEVVVQRTKGGASEIIGLLLCIKD